MANSSDRDDRTEMPSERKLNDARAKGNVPVSREVNILGVLVAATLALCFVVNDAATTLSQTLADLLENAGTWRLDVSGDASQLLSRVGNASVRAIAPIIGLLALGGVLAALLQNRPKVVLERISPKMSRLSPSAGWQRLFGWQSQIDLAKALFKLAALGALSSAVALGMWVEIVNMTLTEAAAVGPDLLRFAVRAFAVMALASFLLSASDILVVRVLWKRGLRMTRQEVKDEHKEQEGNALLKARRRSRARDRLRRRMLADVSRASLVVANPTHYAVALRYVRAEGGAPRVVAKGKDNVALTIRRIAEEQGIPVVEDRVLARSLHDRLEVNQMIPTELYKAVAEILIFLRARGRHRAGHG
jgi:flagellar biosynthesis protein FlhB